MKISLDLNKSVEKNAQLYYEKVKKAKKKLSGAVSTVETYSKKLEKKKKENILSEEKTRLRAIEKNRKRFWFEKFKWFLTSSKSLVIAGKDASSNEELIKKYVEKDDLVFHTSMAGSPFALLKHKKSGKCLTEVANFVFSHSKAWSAGITSGESFYVNPDQVSKSAASGEYISKGSFMVHGKRNFVNSSLDLAIGILHYEGQDLVMSGPLSAVKSNCKKFVVLKPGNKKKEEISKEIMKKLGLVINDDILASLPSGKFAFNR